MGASEIISICVPAVVALASIIVNIVTLAKKGKKTSILSILAHVPDYVSQAESIFGAGNGQAKLQWVLTKVQIDAVKANADISDEQIKESVENVLATPQKKKEQIQQTEV